MFYTFSCLSLAFAIATAVPFLSFDNEDDGITSNLAVLSNYASQSFLARRSFTWTNSSLATNISDPSTSQVQPAPLSSTTSSIQFVVPPVLPSTSSTSSSSSPASAPHLLPPTSSSTTFRFVPPPPWSSNEVTPSTTFMTFPAGVEIITLATSVLSDEWVMTAIDGSDSQETGLIINPEDGGPPELVIHWLSLLDPFYLKLPSFCLRLIFGIPIGSCPPSGSSGSGGGGGGGGSNNDPTKTPTTSEQSTTSTPSSSESITSSTSSSLCSSNTATITSIVCFTTGASSSCTALYAPTIGCSVTNSAVTTESCPVSTVISDSTVCCPSTTIVSESTSCVFPYLVTVAEDYQSYTALSTLDSDDWFSIFTAYLAQHPILSPNNTLGTSTTPTTLLAPTLTSPSPAATPTTTAISTTSVDSYLSIAIASAGIGAASELAASSAAAASAANSPTPASICTHPYFDGQLLSGCLESVDSFTLK